MDNYPWLSHLLFHICIYELSWQLEFQNLKTVIFVADPALMNLGITKSKSDFSSISLMCKLKGVNKNNENTYMKYGNLLVSSVKRHQLPKKKKFLNPCPVEPG